MDVYGVDPGARRLAVACPSTGHVAELVLPKLRRGSKEDVHEALVELVTWFTLTVPPDAAVWVEAVIIGASGNAQTGLRMALTAGAVLASHPGFATTVAIASWKASVVGHGHADKPAVRAWLRDRHPALAEVCGESQDLVDACCIGLYGSAVAQAGELQGTAP